ncbi:hypothetical protein [Clostridium beijerinckii]|uniref:hypothetical protein n=1 Tax=Clostridium beijerinckii TaxID=1520 RepID=UPI00157155F1|nr:hypothetical protein [Clostridium beijerinckii]NRU52701.1 hypothetical protein [Clostridium beijerinckii]
MEKRVGCTLTAGTVATLTNMAIESIKKHKIDMSFYQYIEYEMERVREYSKQTTIKNVVSCLKTALRENWGEEISIPKNSDFNNFDGRDYNYDALEEMALGIKIIIQMSYITNSLTSNSFIKTQNNV